VYDLHVNTVTVIDDRIDAATLRDVVAAWRCGKPLQ
jgi:hypothetical protein